MSRTAVTAIGRLFGTDGIRGPAGVPPLDRQTVERLGAALAAEIAGSGRAPSVVLAGDTRRSTPDLCRWLAAGLAAGGATCRFAGILPTPGVVHLVRELGADCGVAVSASHNLEPDNGIKLIDGAGGKWPAERERALELRLTAAEGGPLAEIELASDPELGDRYLRALERQIPERRPLAGLPVVLDCANGAASMWAPALFERLGARVHPLFDDPEGAINSGCGSTEPEAMAAATAAAGAALGLAFDGDADRVVLADETGRVHDGDVILYLWGRALRAAGELDPPSLVATTMSNLGLEKALAAAGIGLVRCDVGDRNVAEAMRREGLLLGGEQSGHVIHHGLAPTGDGLQTAIHLAALVKRANRPLSELAAGLRRFPQVLLNVRVREKPDLGTLPAVARLAGEVERRLAGRGRLVLRYSGTEPLARIMIEGEERPEVEALAAELAAAIRDEIGDA